MDIETGLCVDCGDPIDCPPILNFCDGDPSDDNDAGDEDDDDGNIDCDGDVDDEED